jgi:hypothetical protein
LAKNSGQEEKSVEPCAVEAIVSKATLKLVRKSRFIRFGYLEAQRLHKRISRMRVLPVVLIR